MPNWVKTRIRVGKVETIKKMEELFIREDKSTNEKFFDLNTIEKMPDSLNVEFSTRADNAITLFVAKIDPSIKNYGVNYKHPRVVKKIKNVLKDIAYRDVNPTEEEVSHLIEKYPTEEEQNELFKLGKKQVENLVNYGCINWYDWRIKHWGTKWNATDTIIDYDNNCIEFNTAWDSIQPLFEKISRMIGDAKIAILYADEDIGYNQGYALLHNGTIDYQGSFENGSSDAQKLACDIWGIDYNTEYGQE